MTPVVDGLRSEFEASLEVRALNLAFGDGRRAFEAYGLPGHPSYVLLNADGEELWRSFGPLPREVLIGAIRDALHFPGQG